MAQTTRKSHDYIVLIFKGMAMMAAELFPGISAASVAKLTGMYNEGIETMSLVSLHSTLEGIKKGRLLWWQKLNISFVIAILFGAMLSLFSLTRLIYELQMETPVLIRAFTLGFLLITIYTTAQKIARWDIINSSALVIGAGISILINVWSVHHPIELTLQMSLVAGLFAGCMFLLPGITIFTVLQFFMIDKQQLSYTHILLFSASFIAGILLTSRGIARLYKSFRNTSFALLLGLIVGGFIRLWPWQMPQDQPVSMANILPINNQLISPSLYADLYGESQIILALILFLSGACIAFLFYLLWTKKDFR